MARETIAAVACRAMGTLGLCMVLQHLGGFLDFPLCPRRGPRW